MAKESLTIIDNRTDKTYEFPLTNGNIRSMDLRQIKKDADDFGIMGYDPGVPEHRVLSEQNHLHRRRQRNPTLSLIPDRATGGSVCRWTK